MALQLFKIASTEVATPQSNIVFSSIPQGYTDLIVKISYRDTYSSSFLTPNMWFNNDYGSTNYYHKWIEGAGSGTPGSSSQSGAGLFYLQNINGASSTGNTFTSVDIYIPNYTNSNYKSASGDIVTENNATTSYAELHAFLWQSTAAINQITFQPPQSFAAGSTFTLYGVL